MAVPSTDEPAHLRPLTSFQVAAESALALQGEARGYASTVSTGLRRCCSGGVRGGGAPEVELGAFEPAAARAQVLVLLEQADAQPGGGGRGAAPPLPGAKKKAATAHQVALQSPLAWEAAGRRVWLALGKREFQANAATPPRSPPLWAPLSPGVRPAVAGGFPVAAAARGGGPVESEWFGRQPPTATGPMPRAVRGASAPLEGGGGGLGGPARRPMVPLGAASAHKGRR
jgi:hypothetical protein